MFTFDTPESPGGLYVNMSTFQVYATVQCLYVVHHVGLRAMQCSTSLTCISLVPQITLQAFGQQYVQLDQQRTGQHLYLHEQWTRVWGCVLGCATTWLCAT